MFVIGCGFLVGLGVVQVAGAQGAVWPGDNGLATPDVSIRLSAFHSDGYLPAFTSAERKISGGEGELSGWLDDRIYVNVRGDYRREIAISGAQDVGPGSLRLLTLANVWQGGVDIQLGWMGLVPFTRDHGEILSDELDVHLLAGLSTDAGTARLGLTGGMAILGNPLRFANQDDAPLLWLTAAVPASPRLSLSGRLGGALPTARNPSRLSSTLSATWGHSWQVGVAGEIGLTPAAADLGGRLWLGHCWGCTAPRRD